MTEQTPIIAITKITINEGSERDYLEIAEQTVTAIRESEESMKYQGLFKDINSASNLTITEIYYNEESIKNHLENPPYCLYMANHEQLGSDIEISIYGDLSLELKEYLSRKNIKINFHELISKFNRLV